jgi:hypothetical protein
MACMFGGWITRKPGRPGRPGCREPPGEGACSRAMGAWSRYPGEAGRVGWTWERRLGSMGADVGSVEAALRQTFT